MNKSILIASSHSSISKSILTDWFAEKEIYNNSPISIWTIANAYQINPVFVRETTFCGFLNHYKESITNKKQLVFGVKFPIRTEKNKEESESEITLWIKNSDGYKDINDLYSECHGTDTENKCLTWKKLKELWTDNLSCSFDFYNSFIQRNLLERHNCIPDLSFITNPVFEISSGELPFDELLKNEVEKYCKTNGYEMINTTPVFYYSKEDFLAYSVFKVIDKKSQGTFDGKKVSIDNPGINFFQSDKFCVEHWAKQNDLKFIKAVEKVVEKKEK